MPMRVRVLLGARWSQALVLVEAGRRGEGYSRLDADAWTGISCTRRRPAHARHDRFSLPGWDGTRKERTPASSGASTTR
ncbi:hypothetical protein K438DRAFT_1797921 [Mycena galopus ATCC 62051]|nr:hypothetical protein K438DRAFT_1797921 [Mycena galopus ATCC 62051]